MWSLLGENAHLALERCAERVKRPGLQVLVWGEGGSSRFIGFYAAVLLGGCVCGVGCEDWCLCKVWLWRKSG